MTFKVVEVEKGVLLPSSNRDSCIPLLKSPAFVRRRIFRNPILSLIFILTT